MSKLQNLVEVQTNTASNRIQPRLRHLLQIFPFVDIRVMCYTYISSKYSDAEKIHIQVTRVIKMSFTDLYQNNRSLILYHAVTKYLSALSVH